MHVNGIYVYEVINIAFHIMPPHMSLFEITEALTLKPNLAIVLTKYQSSAWKL